MNRLILVIISLSILSGITGCATAPRTMGTAKTAAPTQNADGSQSMTLGQAVGAIFKSLLTVRVDVYGADDPRYGSWRNSPNLSYSDRGDHRHHRGGSPAFNEGVRDEIESQHSENIRQAGDLGYNDGLAGIRSRGRFHCSKEINSYEQGWEVGYQQRLGQQRQRDYEAGRNAAR